MAQEAVKSPPSQSFGHGMLFTWMPGLVCFCILAFLLVRIAFQFVTPGSLHRLQLLRTVALPSIGVSQDGQALRQSIHFDRFDFQALDPQTGLLFIAHDGPTVNKLKSAQAELPAGAHLNPSIIVFDTRQNRVVATINGLNVHGITVASDIQKVYAADVASRTVDVIDEQACKAAILAHQLECHTLKKIKVSQNPDSLEYDRDRGEVFVSEPGAVGIVDVINTQTDEVISTIHIHGDMGHIRYDSSLQRIFVVVITSIGSEVDIIDPTTESVSAHISLPTTCKTAHGMAIDTQKHLAFVACMNSRNLVVVDLQAMKAIGNPDHLTSVGIKPDIVAIDQTVHVVFVGSQTALSVFAESAASRGSLTPYGDYTFSSGSSHSIAVVESTHNIYIPLTDVGGRPTMWIEHYDPNGTV